MNARIYTLLLTSSAESEIIGTYGQGQVSKNIIELFNLYLDGYMKEGKRIYDYRPISSNFYRSVIKDRRIRASHLFDKFFEVRKYKDGKTFRKKSDHSEGECKHYRLKPSFIRAHGLKLTAREPWRKMKMKESGPRGSLEIATDNSLKQISVPFDLLAMGKNQIEETFGAAAHERFRTKIRFKEDTVLADSKRIDFELKFSLSDLELYSYWERKLGSYRMYNSLINLLFLDHKSKISQVNHRLNHALLQVPKEALRFIRVDGESLVEFDLKNSQPCILMNIIFGKTRVSSPVYRSALKSMRHRLEQLKSSKVKSLNRNRLIKSSFKGSFYETIQALTTEEISREDAKKAVMYVLFSSPLAKWNPLKDLWINNFKDLYYYIQNLKKALFKAYKDKISDQAASCIGSAMKTPQKPIKGHLAVMLQQVEASIFVRSILSQIFERGLWALTKHDAVLCKQSDSSIVQSIMTSQLDLLLGRGRYALEKSNLCTECDALAA